MSVTLRSLMTAAAFAITLPAFAETVATQVTSIPTAPAQTSATSNTSNAPVKATTPDTKATGATTESTTPTTTEKSDAAPKKAMVKKTSAKSHHGKQAEHPKIAKNESKSSAEKSATVTK